MRFIYQIPAMLRALFRSNRVDADLADEMRFHVDRETQANIARGMSPDAARRAAHLSFGGVGVAQEQSRDDRPGALFRQLLRDVRFGARLLTKAPVFGLTGIAIIALGIGAATAIFSVVYGVMLRPLPFREPERLVSVWLQRASRMYPSAADAAELRQLRGVFTDVALVRSSNANLSLVGDGEPQRLQAARVSPNLFSVLGVSPALGRPFAADEDQTGRDRVVVLSDAFWRGRFNGDAGVIGRQIRLNGTMYTVVGVMPPEFQYPTTSLDAWIPATLEPGELSRELIQNYRIVARLDSRTSLDQARRDVSALAKRLGASYKWNEGTGFSVDSMLEDAVRDIRPALGLLLGAVSFLLLIACVNLSNLFGARATARGGEYAVRLALGASRTRLIVQAVAESAPVLVVGGVLGVVLAQWAVSAFIASAPAGVPRIESIAMSAPVLVLSLTLLVLTGIATSVAPALQAWGADFTTITKDGGRGSTAGRRRTAARRLGVAAQIAFALPLLVGASLLIQSAIKVGNIDLGFRPEHVATVAFQPSETKHVTEQQTGDYYARLVEAVRAVPGVTNAAIVNRIPLSGNQTNPVAFENGSVASDESLEVDSRTVTPDYFATMGVPLVAGRTFTDHDNLASSGVAIVDERLAKTVWPGQSALGKRVRGPDGKWLTVVGVVGHVRTIGVEVDPRPQVYWSVRQWAQTRAVLAVRTTADPRSLFVPVVKAMRSIDADQSVYDLRTMTDIVGRSLAQRRLTTMLMIGFGSIALLLAGVGIYGVVAYGVSQRVREFGIRIALGATKREVTRLVMWQGTSMAVAGAVVGLVFAVAAAGVMSNLVYGVEPRNVMSLAGAAVVLLLISGLASYLPARRAASVDPGIALRSD